MTNINEKGILEDVVNYYREKLTAHGASPLGVDWNGVESQEQRFKQLCKVVSEEKSFSMNDLGCGYGALNSYLRSFGFDYQYNGFDVCKDMIDSAVKLYGADNNANFAVSSTPSGVADYGVASGIFNVKLNHSAAEWLAYVENTINTLDQTSKKGFAFNCLTDYSDQKKMKGYLYYADPGYMFNLCKSRYSRNVALLHDYDLFEFTVVVRKY